MTSGPQQSNGGNKRTSQDEIKFPVRLIRLLREFAYDKEKYLQRVSTHLKSADPNIWMARNGYLKPMQLVSLLHEENSGGFYLQPDLGHLLQRLHDWGIAPNLGGLEQNGSRLTLIGKAIEIYDVTGVLENCVWGSDYMIAKYAKATPAIIVEKNGSEHIGTGSVVRFGSPTNHKFFLLTNKHVVDPAEGITIKSVELNNTELKGFDGAWSLSETDDLAAIEIPYEPTAPYFSIHYELHPLERVISFGYPKIPFADDAYLAFHSGEINTAFRTLSKEEMFLISNQVGPGSSGGPVIDKKGLLIGVTAKAFQGKMEPDAEYLINWNAAVTFKRVRLFLEKVSGLKDWIAMEGSQGNANN